MIRFFKKINMLQIKKKCVLVKTINNKMGVFVSS
jgi:hypothetical protein